MPDPLELEGKFACTSDDFERIMTLKQIGDFRLTNRAERVQTDVYFDTPTLKLRDVSSSLRLREIGAHARATFKGPREAVDSARDESHLVKRVEIELPIEPPPANHGEFVERLDLEPVQRAREIIDADDVLQPIAQLVTHRQIFHYERGSGEAVELSLDNVRALDLRNDRPTRIVEVELELVEGDEDTLVAAATSLMDAIPTLEPSTDSKLARTLGDHLEQQPTGS